MSSPKDDSYHEHLTGGDEENEGFESAGTHGGAAIGRTTGMGAGITGGGTPGAGNRREIFSSRRRKYWFTPGQVVLSSAAKPTNVQARTDNARHDLA